MSYVLSCYNGPRSNHIWLYLTKHGRDLSHNLSSPASEINGKSAATVPKIVHKPLKHIYGKGQRQNSSVNIQNFVSGDYRNAASLRLKTYLLLWKWHQGNRILWLWTLRNEWLFPLCCWLCFVTAECIHHQTKCKYQRFEINFVRY